MGNYIKFKLVQSELDKSSESKASELVHGSLSPRSNSMWILREGITLQLKLCEWSKICDPVLIKFKHVTNIVYVIMV